MYLLKVLKNDGRSHARYIERKTEKAIKKVWDELLASDPKGELDIQLFKSVSYGEQLTLLDGDNWSF